MGGDLTNPPQGKVPTFIVKALLIPTALFSTAFRSSRAHRARAWVTEGAVDEVLDQRADAMLSGKHQRRALMLQLARLDELIEVFTRRPWAATRFAAHCA